MAMHDNAPMGEDPFKVRLELADELWKLGQKQTGRALAQEVADQTHGETRDRAMRWLTERA
jgi:predicted glycosyltransferase